MNMGLALWLIFEFVCFFVFCTFEILGSYFLHFVFVIFLVRIFFVLCIFEKLHLYFFVCKNRK